MVILLPFGPSNISNANAIAEDEYYVDQYENYAMDMANDNYYKSQGSDFIKKIKCNNINVNVNGFNGATLPTALSALATDEAQAADEGEVGASTLGNGGGSDGGGRPSGSDSDSRFVCIDNNDNVVVQEEPISELCEECFNANPTLQTAILDVLVDFDGINIVGTPFGIFVALGPGTDTIEQLCDIIESSASLYGIPFSDALLKVILSNILEVDPEAPNPAIDALIECLLEEGIIVHREIPPPPSPDSISDNPITTQSNNPITTQSNNPITTQSNNPITTQSNNPITTTTTTQSSNM